MTHTHGFLTLILGLTLFAAPSQAVRERVAARCLDYGELARVTVHLRDNDLPLGRALAFANEVTARQGLVAGSRTDLDRQEIVHFVYETPEYTPEAARDYVLLWCTYEWLPRQ
jgi:hypothetical protein